MYIIAGLGNPGKKYEHTRHNVGFDVMDVLAEKYNIRMDEKKYKAICGKGMIGSEKVVLVKPQTFMNLSGESIAEAVNFYKVDPASELLVIFDDISLAPGRIRIRKKGSAGGHNGIKSIQAHIKSQEFDRIRIGIDKDARIPTVDWVLGKIRKEDAQAYQESIEQAAKAAVFALQHSFADAMNQFNKR